MNNISITIHWDNYCYCFQNNELTITDKDGNKVWRNSRGELHRDKDLPAVIHPDGSCSWYQEGQLHRDNGLPAYITSTGYCEWWTEGEQYEICKCTPWEIEKFKLPFGNK